MSVKDPRLSQVLPVIRCSDCGDDVEFRKLGEHICSSAPPMPTLPPKQPTRSGVSSGGYRPGHKPPPIPIANNPSPYLSTAGNGSSGASPHSPLRSAPGTPGVAPRPSLPFLEKEQTEHLPPKTPTEDRYAAPQPNGHRYPPGAARAKTPVNESGVTSFPVSPGSTSPSRASLQQQPSLPQKSNARNPSVASAKGVPGYGYAPGHNYAEREWERSDRSVASMDYASHHCSGISTPSSVSSGVSRAGSSSSLASSILAERGAYDRRERSNTMLSERSELSVRSERSEMSLRSERSERAERSARSERSRYAEEEERVEREREARHRLRQQQDAVSSRSRGRSRHNDPAAAYDTPSPPISPKDGPLDVEMMANGPKAPSLYRPLTPPDVASPIPTRAVPGRRPSVPQRSPGGDQFDALMEDLLQEINVMPTSVRESNRGARSRSRPNVPENGRSRHEGASPPPTPDIPKLTSGVDSARSQRSGRDRAGERSERIVDRERADRDRSDRSDRGGREGERERALATRSPRARSRSTNRRGAVPHCEGCKHDIEPSESAESVKMSHGDYHRGCLKCARCRRTLESASQAHEYEGRVLCEKDYQRYLDKDASSNQQQRSRRPATCAHCDSMIQPGESTVYALGQTYHEHHLTCFQCHHAIDPSIGHIEKNGQVYCVQDYNNMFLPKCRGCNLPVEKEAVCAQDGKLRGKWHAACFGCQTCKKPFPDKSFYVFGDAPYCRRHYHKLNNSLCKTCDQPIEGPCAQTMEGWRFHPNCFCCVECKTLLTDVYYNFEDKSYCERDMMVIQQTRNVRAERRKTQFGKI
ncbi:hypothetical protein KVV02_000572 [Mortierella alpina]|uniref:LIM zinc-binding domain-containing protein n=1 Tax=Mortierella alpina TaxID=64518 RepID=A0A9P8A468_MORAP|nr:hypothetical protein KVV02_000572 [Mortierella alpina]